MEATARVACVCVTSLWCLVVRKWEWEWWLLLLGADGRVCRVKRRRSAVESDEVVDEAAGIIRPEASSVAV